MREASVEKKNDDDEDKAAKKASRTLTTPTARKSKSESELRAVSSNAWAGSHTLLPGPMASLVTLVTQSTSLSLRVGACLGGIALDSARTTTLTGLELSRAMVEGILVRAGRDVVARSGYDYGKAEAESLLEKSLATLHTTITSASFFAAAGFHLSSVTLSSLSTFSLNLLSTLDATLGSSESSRAIASFVTLIKREFRNSDASNRGTKLRVDDLLVGLVGFALLQRWGRRKTEREIRENGKEVTVWDVVLLDNGLRADVVGTQRSEYATPAEDGENPNPSERRPASFFAPDNTGENGNFEAVERRSAEGREGTGTGTGTSAINSLGRLVPHVSLPADQQHQLSDEDIRHYIMNQLPPGSQALIKTDTVTARTITVDLFDDDDDLDIAPPPGAAMIEERFNHVPDDDGSKDGDSTAAGNQLPKHTVVFRTVYNVAQSADLRHEQQGRRQSEDLRKAAAGQAPTDRNSGNRTSRQPSKEEVPETSSNERPRKHAREPSAGSASSTSGSETPKGSFGKASFARFTQRVMANTDEKLGHKTPLKKFSRALVNANAPDGPGGAEKQNSTCMNSPPSAAAPRPNTKKSRTRPAETELPSANPASKPLQRAAPATLKLSPTNATSKHAHHDSQCSSSAASYYSLREESTESYTAQTDAYSRPSSPNVARNHVRSNSSLTRTKSDKDMPILHGDNEGGNRANSPTFHRRSSSKSLVPSVYSMAPPMDSTTSSLVLAPRPPKSVFENQATISALSRDGYVSELFPSNHLAENIQRFCRFSSASYGSNFLRMMGISTGAAQDWRKEGMDHHEHSSFSDHTGLPATTILLSSFVDPAGGSNAAGETAEGFPLVHYLSLDHESKAVVLTLRGTWGFEDILTDMTCDYDELYWMGKSWQVHKGMHASARRLLQGGGGRVMATIKAALEEFPDYGVIFCGHSLGGGVAALLATLLARPKEPGNPGPMFVTAPKHRVANPLLLAAGTAATNQTESQKQKQQQQPASSPFSLPAGRPIHVYAYGPPALMSPFLQHATRGLITTIVNGQDVVPALSLGTLHDLLGVSLAFKHDMAEAKSYVRSRVWERITHSIINRFYVHQPPFVMHAGDGVGEDSWAWTTLLSLRENLSANKLLPPGEVFVVETMRVLQRDAFTSDSSSSSSGGGGGGPDGSPRLGRPATRVQLKYIRDVEQRFREIRFGSGMFGDHSPARYETSLAALARGVLEG